MKRVFGILLSVSLLLGLLMTTAAPVSAAKPGNNAGAVTVGWNLSGAVMPVPPYGLSDLPGSDVASKLIVNQPNGATVVTITGVMGKLTPNTIYTVFISRGYNSGATGWSGFFTNTIPDFTFTTDASGAGSWHVNMTNADFPGVAPSSRLSVWINNDDGATILISNNFIVQEG